MHEMSLAAEIHRMSRAVADRNGTGRIEAVKVAIGELSAVEPDLLAYAWEALTAGGTDAGSRLEIEWHAARQTCPRCREIRERAPGSWLRLCPDCGAPLHVQGGTELDLLEVVLGDSEGAGGPDR